MSPEKMLQPVPAFDYAADVIRYRALATSNTGKG